MDKYIKLDTAKKTLLDYIYEFDASRGNPDFVRGITYAREVLDRVPLEDVATVVYGRWIDFTNAACKCSACDAILAAHSYYCPNCGAKMIGG